MHKVLKKCGKFQIQAFVYSHFVLCHWWQFCRCFCIAFHQ